MESKQRTEQQVRVAAVVPRSVHPRVDVERVAQRGHRSGERPEPSVTLLREELDQARATRAETERLPKFIIRNPKYII